MHTCLWIPVSTIFSAVPFPPPPVFCVQTLLVVIFMLQDNQAAFLTVDAFYSPLRAVHFTENVFPTWISCLLVAHQRHQACDSSLWWNGWKAQRIAGVLAGRPCVPALSERGRCALFPKLRVYFLKK